LDESVILYDLNAAVSLENYNQVYSLIIAIGTLSKTCHMNSQVRQPIHKQKDKLLESDLEKNLLYLGPHLNLFCISKLYLEVVASL